MVTPIRAAKAIIVKRTIVRSVLASPVKAIGKAIGKER